MVLGVTSVLAEVSKSELVALSDSSKYFKLSNAYDSHVHWEGTGAKETALDLSHLKSPNDIFKIKTQRSHFRESWLVGYNWDQSQWKGSENPDRRVLDQLSYKGPILLHRSDRHAAWVNTEALKAAGFYRKWENPQIEGGIIHLDSDGYPTGYVVDRAMDLIKKHIPEQSSQSVYDNLKKSCEIFNRAGYTYIRDLTCNEKQWNESIRLFENNELTLAVEQFFDFDGAQNIDAAIRLALLAKKESPQYIQVKGIKIYYDGALGSEGALLSCPYHGKGHNFGFALYDKKVLKDILRKIYDNNLEAAVHVIGDQAAEDVVSLAHDLRYKDGFWGSKRLHLEHAELLRLETIKKMTELDVICHLQPCHWLTDKAWVDQKLGMLKQHLFRWHDLEANKISFDFGSDSPIEPASISLNLKAIQDAAMYGVKKTTNDPRIYMQNTSAWVDNCATLLSEDMSVVQTVFNNKIVYQKRC